MRKWEDVSSYSRSENDREPKTWVILANRIKITVTRHIDYPKDRWVLFSPPWISALVLESKNIDDAKKEAIKIIKTNILESLSHLPN